MRNYFELSAPLNTAVLFLVFNRPEVTAQVFQSIRQAKPPRLYIAADGPRADKLGESERCAKVRRIATAVDWPCEVKTLFRDKNLGCKVGVSSGINWFFKNEEAGIILEDDCLPSQSFFWFCEELLDRYMDEEKIGMISGNNLFDEKISPEESYFFSYGNIWGWASWRRSWNNYDVTMRLWKDRCAQDSIKLFLNNDNIFNKLSVIFEQGYRGAVDTWDYQWLFSRLLNKQFTINPSANLVSNIGFGEEATHTVGKSKFSNLKAHEIEFLLTHPKNIKINERYINYQYSLNVMAKIKHSISFIMKLIRD